MIQGSNLTNTRQITYLTFIGNLKYVIFDVLEPAESFEEHP